MYGACAPGALRSAEIFFDNKNKKISVYWLYWYKSTNPDAVLHIFSFLQLLDRMEVARIVPQVMKASVYVLLYQ